jgi:ubiquinone/menaquinone biosynthesis C-methylase UbiE
MSSDSRQAEKEYLARTGSSSWERVKPFSQPGADTLAGSAQLLHDFAVAMMALKPAPGDLVLDLGAGGGWCSDLLGRLNRRSVAVDISLDMLRTARSRPGGAAIRAVTGDLEALPFRSASFHKALCLNAIHHVPDIPAAVREIGRVLTDDGTALFLEPGRGHANTALSTSAMRDYGVLEQDVIIADFAEACRAAGFRDVRVHTLLHAIPGFDLPLERWQRWAQAVSQKRPYRAVKKMLRAAAEMLGLGKRTFLFEDAFSMSVLRALCHASEDNPIILASKAVASTATDRRAARIEVGLPNRVARGASFPARATLTNVGPTAWQAMSRTGVGHVALGVQLLDESARIIVRDFHRVSLPGDVTPGTSVAVSFDCPAPADPGVFVLKFDLVAEGVTWFEAEGSDAATARLVVT